MSHSSSTDSFNAVRIGWINALSHAGIQEALKEVAKPANSGMRAGADIAPLIAEKGGALPKNMKATLAAAAGDEPVGVRLCVAFNDESGNPTYHCMTIRNPITFG